MNKAFRKYLTDAEVQIIEETKPANLAELDEDELGDLHDRVRRASRKYRKLHRRQASAQVRADRGRGKAAAKNPRICGQGRGLRRCAGPGEPVAEQGSKGVSQRAEGRAPGSCPRLVPPVPPGPRSPGQGPGSGRTPSKKRSPVAKKKDASTLAAGARRQAKRDAR